MNRTALWLLMTLLGGFGAAQADPHPTFIITVPGSAAPTLPGGGAGYAGGVPSPAALPPPRIDIGVPNIPDPASLPGPSGRTPAPFVPPAPLVMAAPASLEILPDGREWGALPLEQQQNLSRVIAREPELRHLLGRIRAQQNGLSLEDIQLATRLWLNGSARGDAALMQSLERTLVNGSGVIRLLPNAPATRYRDLYSEPNSELGQRVRAAANETLAIESRLAPYIGQLSETDRIQLSAFILEMHEINLLMDRAIVSNSGHWRHLADTMDQIRGRALNVAAGALSEVPGTVIGLVLAETLPFPALVAAAAYGVYEISNDIITGEMSARLQRFSARITGPDRADADRAVGEAAVMLGTIVSTGPLSTESLSARWLAIREGGLSMAALRVVWRARLGETRDLVAEVARDWAIGGGVDRLIAKATQLIDQAPAFGGEVLRFVLTHPAGRPPEGMLALLEQSSALGGVNPADFGIHIPVSDRPIQIFYGTPIREIPASAQGGFLGGVAVQVELAPGTTLFRFGAPNTAWFVRQIPRGTDPHLVQGVETIRTPIRVWEGLTSPFALGSFPGGSQAIYIPPR